MDTATDPHSDEMTALLDAAVDRGVTFFDTAEAYGPHANEELVGQALALVGGTASSLPPTSARTSTRVERKARRPTRGAPTRGAERRRPRARCSDSASTPSTSSTSTGSPPYVPIEEFAGAVKMLIDAGKVKHYGMSEACRRDDPPRPRRAAGERVPERVLAVVATPRRRGARHLRGARQFGFVPYSPLGKGFLTGTIDTSTSFETGNDLR